MKTLDKLLRAQRTRMALGGIEQPLSAVLDIGCGDGYLLRLVDAGVRDGIDPTLDNDSDSAGIRLRTGSFPNDLARLGMLGPYDAIFAIAVFEHLTGEDLVSARAAIPELLAPGGRLAITVPHPLVDRILDVLMFLHLVDGQSVEEHHGFDPQCVLELQSGALKLVAHRRFQLGLNNLFLFERCKGPCN